VRSGSLANVFKNGDGFAVREVVYNEFEYVNVSIFYGLGLKEVMRNEPVLDTSSFLSLPDLRIEYQ
jgi:hypothetical protein